ncbi:MAG: glycosyltransferase [Solirubrobacteraceae bacterium]|nr:glycosyltransferase [Solirubrobacteraceae bacterium]
MGADVTIAIPTFEGDPALLRRVFEAAAAQSERPVLVVDMSRTDVVADAAAATGRVDVVRLPGSRGVSHSRNELVRRAGTRYVLFLDSDAVPEPGWLDAMRAGFEQPDVAIVGARVLPAWPRRPPRLIDSVTARDWISMFDLGDAPQPVPRVMGTSYALDRERVGDAPFHETLGRRPGVEIAHEEVQLALDATRAGWRCWYAPDAVVHHHIGRDRTTWRFMVRRAFTAGREIALWGDDSIEPLPRPPFTWRDHAFRALMAPAFLAGRLRGP